MSRTMNVRWLIPRIVILLNLKANYPGRFLPLSILLISDHTLHLFEKFLKRRFQEESLAVPNGAVSKDNFGDSTTNL